VSYTGIELKNFHYCLYFKINKLYASIIIKNIRRIKLCYILIKYSDENLFGTEICTADLNQIYRQELSKGNNDKKT
jgi:hypothetical protein